MPKSEHLPLSIEDADQTVSPQEGEEMTREDWLSILPLEDVDNPLARAYILHRRGMGSTASLYSQRPDVREEAPQEIFRRLLDPDLKSTLPGSESEHRAYLNGAAANYAKDTLRRQKRIVFDSLTGFENYYASNTEEEDVDPDLKSSIDEAGTILWEAAQGLTYEEIATKINLPKTTVRMRLYRAREKLKSINPKARDYADAVKSSKSVQGVPLEPSFSDENPQENEK